jgi:hypothetical protein
MVSAKTTRPDSEGQDSITKSLKFSSESLPRPRRICSDCGWILSKNKSRATFINSADELSAKRRLCESCILSCIAILLAGIASAYQVYRLNRRPVNRGDIAQVRHVRPVLR